MSALIRIYTKFGKEHVYTFEGYSTLNNVFTIYSSLGVQDVSILNFKNLVREEEPCRIHVTDRSNDLYTTTEVFVEGARLIGNDIIFDIAELRFTNHREE
jgi:hypothetical protein